MDGLMQDCSNSSALAMELLQSCTKPSKKSINKSKFVISVQLAWFIWNKIQYEIALNINQNHF